jgi:hypothetical protein
MNQNFSKRILIALLKCRMLAVEQLNEKPCDYVRVF